MRSVQLQAAYETAEKIDKDLPANLFKHDQLVMVKHLDGTEFNFRGALVREIEGHQEFIAVHTEHSGLHVFTKDELTLLQSWTLKRDHTEEPSGA